MFLHFTFILTAIKQHLAQQKCYLTMRPKAVITKVSTTITITIAIIITIAATSFISVDQRPQSAPISNFIKTMQAIFEPFPVDQQQ